MSLKTFVEAMPKVDLHVQLEGSFDIQRLLLIAEQHDVPETLKHYDTWAGLLRKPDYGRLYDLIRMVNTWVKDSGDLSWLAYDLGTHLHKQGVVYAEVGVCPSYYPEVQLDIEALFAAINDGRERAEKAWGIRMAWIYNVPRDEPRRVEDAARWATSIPAQRANVVGMGLIGRDDVQPPLQFERAFRALEKRELARVVRVGEMTNTAGVKAAYEPLLPTRLVDARGAVEDGTLIEQVVEHRTALLISPTRSIRHKWTTAADLPLRRLVDMGAALVIGADMPTLYQTTLNKEYIAAVEQGGLTIEEVIEVALNAVAHSTLSQADKDDMIASFQERYATLQVEHLSA
ncbi:MAG: hypothetical protein SGJ24_00185 [Chloroflexota bacterium]|nr:hypothetical protein [Chloroflexota bacterium]